MMLICKIIHLFLCLSMQNKINNIVNGWLKCGKMTELQEIN